MMTGERLNTAFSLPYVQDQAYRSAGLQVICDKGLQNFEFMSTWGFLKHMLLYTSLPRVIRGYLWNNDMAV